MRRFPRWAMRLTQRRNGESKAPRLMCAKRSPTITRENFRAQTARSMKPRKVWRPRLSRKRCARDEIWGAHAPRVLAMAPRHRELSGRLFRRGAETCTRGACAPRFCYGVGDAGALGLGVGLAFAIA